MKGSKIRGDNIKLKLNLSKDERIREYLVMDVFPKHIHVEVLPRFLHYKNKV